MRKGIATIMGVIGLLAINTPIFGDGVFYNMVINYIPNPGACQVFINSGALYMDVNPGLPDSMTGGTARALVNPNSTVALQNAHPGYTIVVPRLDENAFCSAQCAIVNSNQNCWQACKFAVSNFYSVQKPTYTVPNGTIFVRCPTLTMSKYPNYPSDPYTKFPYTRP